MIVPVAIPHALIWIVLLDAYASADETFGGTFCPYFRINSGGRNQLHLLGRRWHRHHRGTNFWTCLCQCDLIPSRRSRHLFTPYLPGLTSAFFFSSHESSHRYLPMNHTAPFPTPSVNACPPCVTIVKWIIPRANRNSRYEC